MPGRDREEQEVVLRKISLEDRVVVKEGLLHRRIGDEVVLVELDSGTYFGLGEVGAVIWQSLAEDGRLEEAHRRVLAEFAVEPERLTQDLLSLVEDLLAQGLVRTSS